jgi:hypothetical protein
MKLTKEEARIAFDAAYGLLYSTFKGAAGNFTPLGAPSSCFNMSDSDVKACQSLCRKLKIAFGFSER